MKSIATVWAAAKWRAWRLRDRALASTLSLETLERVVECKLERNSEFVFNSTRLQYFFHSYNNFGLTERSIEIPIVKHFLETGGYKHVLEIGNVTNHYYDYFREVFLKARKTVVDKYEPGYDVINLDVRKFTSDVRFDFVFSISTFEHMDSDLGRNPEYTKGAAELISVAADNIRYVGDALLAPGGKLLITAPVGYTPEWDETFYSGVFDRCGFSRCRLHLFRRVGEIAWEQVPPEMGRGAPMTSWQSARDYLSVVELDK